jgi:hypothetical protein
MAKRRNPSDATLRNIRATRTAMKELQERVALLEVQARDVVRILGRHDHRLATLEYAQENARQRASRSR